MACLPTLSGREDCDELAVNFCYVNSKGARKRMVGPNPLLQPQLRTLAVLQTSCHVMPWTLAAFATQKYVSFSGVWCPCCSMSCSNGATSTALLMHTTMFSATSTLRILPSACKVF